MIFGHDVQAARERLAELAGVIGYIRTKGEGKKG